MGEKNTLSILSLVFGFLLPILGIIFGIIALVQISKDPQQEGKGLAIAGIVLGVVLTVLPLLIMLLLGLAFTGNIFML